MMTLHKTKTHSSQPPAGSCRLRRGDLMMGIRGEPVRCQPPFSGPRLTDHSTGTSHPECSRWDTILALPRSSAQQPPFCHQTLQSRHWSGPSRPLRRDAPGPHGCLQGSGLSGKVLRLSSLPTATPGHMISPCHGSALRRYAEHTATLWQDCPRTIERLWPARPIGESGVGTTESPSKTADGSVFWLLLI